MSLKVSSYYRGSKLPAMPSKNMFHSDTLFHLLEQTPGCNPVLLTIWRDGVPLCRMLAVVQRLTGLWRLGKLRRCISFGFGEYFCDESEKSDLQTLMLSQLKRYANRMGCFITEVRNLEQPLDGYAAFKRNEFFATRWMRVVNPLPDAQEDVEQDFSTSRRRQIRKGLKNGAVVSELSTTEEIEEFTAMLNANKTARIRRHFLDIEFYKMAASQLLGSNLYRTFLVKYNGKVIGGCVCIYSENKAYVMFSGGLRKTYRAQHPGELAVWKALTAAQSKGIGEVEFMDVGVPFRRHGYRDFVLRFGGIQQSTRRWFYLRWNWLNRLFRMFYS